MARVDIEVAATICGVKPGTVRRWVADGRVTAVRERDPRVGRIRIWFDVNELLQWNDARDPDAIYSRAGLKPGDRPADTRHAHRRAS